MSERDSLPAIQDKPTSVKAQDIQDKIFQRMSADQKVKVGSDLWKLAKELVGDKIYKYHQDEYERN